MKRYLSYAVLFVALAAFVGCASAPSAEKPAAAGSSSAGETGKAIAQEKPVSADAKTAEAPKAEAAPVIPQGKAVLLDNFEDGNYWAAVGNSWDQWGSHNLSLEAELSKDWGTDGPTSADWLFDKIPAAGGQATFFCDQLIETDWTGAKYIVLDVKNPEAESFTLCFSCQTTEGWKWTQTPTVEVKPGAGVIVFDLTKDLKDGANASVPSIDGIDQMKRAMFNVMTYGAKGGSGRFYVDNIRLIK